MTPPGVGWRCSNRMMSGMALAVVAKGDRLARPGDVARMLVPSVLTHHGAYAAVTITALTTETLTIGFAMHGDTVHDLTKEMVAALTVLSARDVLATVR